MRAPLEIKVECYSGYKADERPLRFYLAGRCLEVQEILDRWYSPGATWFRVRVSTGGIYVLKHFDDGQHEIWTVEAFRSQ